MYYIDNKDLTLKHQVFEKQGQNILFTYFILTVTLYTNEICANSQPAPIFKPNIGPNLNPRS